MITIDASKISQSDIDALREEVLKGVSLVRVPQSMFGMRADEIIEIARESVARDQSGMPI